MEGGTPYKPYVWLESITTSSAQLHFIVSLPEGMSIPNEPTSCNDMADTRKRVITYTTCAPKGDEDPYNIERQHALDGSTGYDPVFDDIIIQIFEEVSGDKKGQGSVHHSEGDTSGGD